MRSLLVMAILMFSLGVTGCSKQQEFHYKDIAEPLENGDEYFGSDLLEEDYTAVCKEKVRLGDGAEVIDLGSKVHISFGERRYTKFVYNVFTSCAGVASCRIEFTFADGTSSITEVPAIDLEKRYRFTGNLGTGNIVQVEVALRPMDRVFGDVRAIDTGSDLEKQSANTILCRKAGLVALLDDKSAVVDTIEMKKGSVYVTVFGTEYYCYLE